jgi:hypothetical protein
MAGAAIMPNHASAPAADTRSHSDEDDDISSLIRSFRGL